MDMQFFNSEKAKYNSIEIPLSLDTRVRQSLAIGKKKRMKVKIIKSVSVAAIFLCILISTVNIFPQVAQALSSVPVIDKLISLISFDKGLKNAVEKGALQNVFFTEEKNGIKLTITSIAGDQNHLWVGYKLEGEGNLMLTSPHITDLYDKSIPHFSSIYYGDEAAEKYFEIGFAESAKLPATIKLLCNIDRIDYSEPLQADEFGSSRESTKVADFEIPITLDESIMQNYKRPIEGSNKGITTDIGTLNFFSLTTSTTRTSLEFTLSSDEYKFMGFKNPRLEDSLGNIYPASGAYSSLTVAGRNNIDFQGEIKDGLEGLTFKCDGIYYVKTDEDTITVDLKNRLVEHNSFGFRFVSLNNNKLTIASEDISSVNLDELDGDTKDNPVRSMGMSLSDNNGKRAAEVYFDISGYEGDKLILKISHLISDNMLTEPYEIQLKP